MKESIKEAIDKFIYKLKEISKLFKVIMEGEKKFSLVIEDKNSIEYKIICIDNILNLDYEKHLPVLQDGKYSRWMPNMLDVIGLIADINNTLIEYSISCIELLQYMLSKENSIYFESYTDKYYLCAN